MRCPVCRAEVTQGPTCRRCRADLSLLLAVENQRAQALARAVSALAAGDAARAAAFAEQAGALRQGEDARRLRAVASLLLRDYASAWREYRYR